MNGYRIEKKYLIGIAAAVLLRARLAPFTRPDPQAEGGAYRIRSLYFDTPDAGAFWEKTNGEADRTKYRIRYYNGDTTFIRLECKEKHGELTRKTQAPLTLPQAQALSTGDYTVLANDPHPLCRRFYAEAKAKQLLPSVTVDYRRLPMVYGIDNVRITVDSDIYAGQPAAFLSPATPAFPVLDAASAVLEVKTDDRLPVMIGRILEAVPRQPQSYSKFAMSFARLHGIE